MLTEVLRHAMVGNGPYFALVCKKWMDIVLTLGDGDDLLFNRLCIYSAQYGWLGCLKHACKDRDIVEHPRLKGILCTKAAGAGKLDCLKYAHEVGFSWSAATCTTAAQSGHLECLKYAHENGCPMGESSRDGRLATTYAAYGGHLDCLIYAHTNGCAIDATTYKAALGNGNAECIDYCRRKHVLHI